MSDTITCPTSPTSPAGWAHALDEATAARATTHELDPHSAASDVLSIAHSAGTTAGVSLASGELHALHELGDDILLSADGEWIATWWHAQGGYWIVEHYELPAVRVAIDMAHDLRVAGHPDHPVIVDQQRGWWRRVARRIADELLADLTIVYATYGSEAADGADPTHDDDGDLTLAGRIWQGAHDVTGSPVGAAWTVADLTWNEDLDGWALTVQRLPSYSAPEHIETIVTGSALPPDCRHLEIGLRKHGYHPIGGWLQTEGYGDYGILVERAVRSSE